MIAVAERATSMLDFPTLSPERPRWFVEYVDPVLSGFIAGWGEVGGALCDIAMARHGGWIAGSCVSWDILVEPAPHSNAELIPRLDGQ